MPVKAENGGPMATDIASRISHDFLKSGGKKAFLPAERSLMEQYGVARNTIRRALAHLTEQGLIRAEHGRGYRILRANDKSVEPHRIAVLQASESSKLYQGRTSGELVEALQRQSLKRKWQVLNVDVEDLAPATILATLKDANVEAVALVLAEEGIYRSLIKAGIPCVALESAGREFPIDYIFQDGFGGARTAAQHLLSKGHKKIAWVGAVSTSLTSYERWAGAKSVLLEDGMDFDAHDIVSPDNGLEKDVTDLLSRQDRPTAVLAMWRRQVVAVVNVAVKLGMELGKDLDVVGWCTEKQYGELVERDFPANAVPPMIVWSPDEMADVVVARLLLHRLEPELKALHIAVPTRLVLPEGGKNGGVE